MAASNIIGFAREIRHGSQGQARKGGRGCSRLDVLRNSDARSIDIDHNDYYNRDHDDNEGVAAYRWPSALVGLQFAANEWRWLELGTR